MKTNQPLTIKKYVSSLALIVRSKGQNTLGSVLSRVRSSHEAIFIFNDKDKFLGLLSPFKTLYSSNFPYTTKVSSISFKPPTITEETPIYQVAKYMLSTKIYVLPVFDKKGVIQSVIHAKDIFHEIIKDPDLLDFVSTKIELHTPITSPITASVKDVFYQLKEKGVSRMVLVDAEERLAGIVTRRDLMQVLIRPTSKMRFPKEGTHAGFYSLAGEKKFRKDEPVSKYSTAMIDSLSANASKKEIITHLITSPHDSIILIDKYHRPTGLLSTRDILKAIGSLRPEEDITLIIKRPSDAVSDRELEQATKHLEVFGRKLNKRMEIAKIEVTSEEPKKPKGNTMIFNITVVVTPVAGKSIVAVTKQKKFIDGIQEATKLIEKQRRRGVTFKRRKSKSDRFPA